MYSNDRYVNVNVNVCLYVQIIANTLYKRERERERKIRIMWPIINQALLKNKKILHQNLSVLQTDSHRKTYKTHHLLRDGLEVGDNGTP